jgi:hypothetical protein
MFHVNAPPMFSRLKFGTKKSEGGNTQVNTVIQTYAHLAAYLTVDEPLTCMFPNMVLQFLKT